MYCVRFTFSIPIEVFFKSPLETEYIKTSSDITVRGITYSPGPPNGALPVG